MKVSRLDNVTENMVSISTQRKLEEQKLFVLQDISATLAMIYDYLTKDEEDNAPFVIDEGALCTFDEMFFESTELPTGYAVNYVRTEKKNVVLSAFGDEMAMPLSEYGKKWRCWNTEPSKAISEVTKWEK